MTGLGAATAKVVKQDSKFVLDSELATQARSSRDHNVRRRVEALLAPHGLRLFSLDDDEDEDEEPDEEEEDDNEEEDEGKGRLVRLRAYL